MAHRNHTLLLNAAHVAVADLRLVDLCSTRERRRGGNGGVGNRADAGVYGKTSAVLGSLFGQLHRVRLTSAAEVNPDTLMRVNSTTLDFSQFRTMSSKCLFAAAPINP